MIRFYLFSSTKTIVISDRPLSDIKERYQSHGEILTTVSPDSYSLVKERILKPYSSYSVVELWKRKKRVISEAGRENMRLARLGKPRPIESNRKTSEKLKGRSNFAGKKHSEHSKEAIAQANIGNQKASELYWCHNPLTGQETRVVDRNRLPAGFVLGRDYDAVESLYLANRARKK